MKRLTILIALLFYAAFLYGQDRETRNLNAFDGIDVGEGIELILEQGNEERAVIETEGIDTDRVITEVRGSRLSIHLKRGSYRSKSITVYLTYKKLREIDVNSAARVTTKSTIKANDFSISVDSAGKAVLDLEVGNLDLSVDSAGRLELSGTCDFQELQVDSAGKYLGFALKSKNARARVDSAGKAEIYVSEDLRANADSGGSITYKGDPKKVIADADSGGRIRKG